MPERDGSDLQRICNFISFFSIDSKLIENDVFHSRSMSDPPLSDIYFKNKMAWVWTTLYCKSGISNHPVINLDLRRSVLVLKGANLYLTIAFD